MNISDLNEVLQRTTHDAEVVEEERRQWRTQIIEGGNVRRHQRKVTVLYTAGLRELMEVFAYLSSQVSPDATVLIRTTHEKTVVTADWSEPV